MLTPIKIHRLRSNLRQIQVAQVTGIPRCRLSEIECGYITPRTEELERIASALGVSVTDLVPAPPTEEQAA